MTEDFEEKMENLNAQNPEDVARMMQEAHSIIDNSGKEDLLLVMAEGGGRTSLVTNGGAYGLMHTIEVLSVHVGRMLIHDKEGREDPPMQEAFLVGSMAVARSCMDRVQQMKDSRDQGEPNGEGGKHYADSVTDHAKGSEGTGGQIH